ncbi:MAG: GspH/FimT family pseudopilin [Tepidimonas ignava]|uniref:GspH/FimT family pseudopilin n=1 Tax=Tepidimonas ignava TaxID=114249 RepID=UPI003919B26B
MVPHHRRARVRGLTLVEVIVVAAVLATLIGVALPAIGTSVERSRLRGAADVLSAELRQAQSEALKRQRTIVVSVSADDTQWCLGWREQTACDCARQPTDCLLDGVARVRTHADHPNVVLAPAITGGAFVFSPRRGTATAGNLTLALADGSQIRIVVHGLGRIRQCIPDGAPALAALPGC